jgi:hypothetical protein
VDVTAFPQPVLGHGLLHLVGHLVGEPPQQDDGQLGAGAAVQAGIRGARAALQRHDEDQDAQGGGATRSIGTENLGEEGPQDHGRVVNGALRTAKVNPFGNAGRADLLGREDVGKGQAVVGEEGSQSGLEGSTRSRRGIKRHEALLVPQ